MERFISRLGIILAAVFIFFLNSACGGYSNKESKGEKGLAPQQVVLKYYRALQNRDFSGAWQCISRGMRDDKNKQEWVKFMKYLFEGGKVVITEISVSPGPVSGQEAKVNTVIISQDIINKNGLIEYNLEHLVLEDGLWKIDRTELEDSKIIEPPLP